MPAPRHDHCFPSAKDRFANCSRLLTRRMLSNYMLYLGADRCWSFLPKSAVVRYLNVLVLVLFMAIVGEWYLVTADPGTYCWSANQRDRHWTGFLCWFTAYMPDAGVFLTPASD